MTTQAYGAHVPQAVRTTEPVLVVGAGPAGLAAAAELSGLGVPAEILERGDKVASAWRGRNDRLRLNTNRWKSTLPGERFPRGTLVFPTRDDLVRYLETYAKRFELTVRFGVRVDRIDPCDGGWSVSTSAGPYPAKQVVVAIGHQHTPRLPDWPGMNLYPCRLLHSAECRNAKDFRGADMLVVGAGCSGMEIAYDLALGGAGRVRIAVRTLPNIVLRTWGWLPNDFLIKPLFRLPPRNADAIAEFLRRHAIGDLAPWGLMHPKDGVFTSLLGGKVPSVVDIEVIEALRAGQIEVVAGVASVDQDGVRLDDETVLRPDVIVAETGYSTGLDPLVGHLGVLSSSGVPHVHGGPPVQPGLRFIGYDPQIQKAGQEARRVAQQISEELRIRSATT